MNLDYINWKPSYPRGHVCIPLPLNLKIDHKIYLSIVKTSNVRICTIAYSPMVSIFHYVLLIIDSFPALGLFMEAGENVWCCCELMHKFVISCSKLAHCCVSVVRESDCTLCFTSLHQWEAKTILYQMLNCLTCSTLRVKESIKESWEMAWLNSNLTLKDIKSVICKTVLHSLPAKHTDMLISKYLFFGVA